MSLAWGGHKNGQIALSLLESIGPSVYGLGTQYAHPAAAAAWRRLLAAAKEDGVTLTVGEGYRDLARQRKLYGDWLAGRGNVAAFPGTSNHGWGRAIDVGGYTPEEMAWLKVNGPKFGWSWVTGRASGEPWHWEYVGSLEVPVAKKWKDRKVRIIERVEPGYDFECSVFGADLSGPTELERGYFVVTDVATARGLARTWDDGWGNHKKEPRAAYIEEQAAARVAHENWLRSQGKGSDLNPVLQAIAALQKIVVAGFKSITDTLARIFK